MPELGDYTNLFALNCAQNVTICFWQSKKSARGRRKSQHFGLSRQNAIIEKVNARQTKKSARGGNILAGKSSKESPR